MTFPDQVLLAAQATTSSASLLSCLNQHLLPRALKSRMKCYDRVIRGPEASQGSWASDHPLSLQLVRANKKSKTPHWLAKYSTISAGCQAIPTCVSIRPDAHKPAAQPSAPSRAWRGQREQPRFLMLHTGSAHPLQQLRLGRFLSQCCLSRRRHLRSTHRTPALEGDIIHKQVAVA